MRRRFRSAFAVVAGVLLVTTAALGGAMMQPGVDSVDDAAGQYVERGEGQIALGAGIVVGAAAYYTYDNYIKNSPNTNAEELAKTDALETKKEIYDQASIQQANNDLTNTAYGNYLNDTESIALMEGKNAYIRALENGSAESVARNRANEAVADYYAAKQQNIIAAWNVSAAVIDSSINAVANTSGIETTYITTEHDYMNVRDPANKDISLVNSTTVGVEAVNVESSGDADVIPSTGNVTISSGSTTSETVHSVVVQAPNSNYDDVTVLRFGEFATQWSAVQSQNSEVQSQLDTFIDNTYSSYRQGDINTSDLVDPYLGAREYSPETSDTWTLRTLSAMGMDTPENLSNIGRMNVTASGNTYTGVLMSDGTPSGGYVVGETYDATNLTGAQFVATDDGDAVELEGSFTLDSARTTSGEEYAEGESVAYENVSYQTANTSEFKALQEDLDRLTAEINARQQEQRNAGGGGILPDFGQGGAIPGALLLAGAAAFLLSRD